MRTSFQRGFLKEGRMGCCLLSRVNGFRSVMFEFLEKQVNEYAKRYGWIPKENGEIFFVQNHEATVKSRNIEEKLQFEHEFPFLIFHRLLSVS